MKLKPYIFGLILSVPFLSCDTDSLELNNSIFGDQNFIFTTEVVNSGLKVESELLNPIQSDNLGVAPFGILNNYLGDDANEKLQKVEAHYVSQLILPTSKLTFPVNNNVINVPTVEKVVLYVPYLSNQTGISDGVTQYNINEVFSNLDPNSLSNSNTTPPTTLLNTLNLSIYENQYQLRDFNPGSNNTQEYYSDKYNDINAVSATNRLNVVTMAPAQDAIENEQFYFRRNQIVYKLPKANETDEEKEEKLAPGLFAHLNPARFQEIIDQYKDEQTTIGSSKIYNQNIFNTWFKGLFLKIEENTSDSKQLAMLNFANAYVKVYYKETAANTTATKSIKNFDLRFGGRSITLYNNDNNQTVDLSNDDKFILQGNHGKMATIKLFNNNELLAFRSEYKNNHLINEAELTFHVASDFTVEGNTYFDNYNPYRIYLYDYTNNRVISDFVDTSAQNASPRDRYNVFGGFYEKVNKVYKIRITEHIKKLLSYELSPSGELEAQEANVELGLVIVQNISDFGFKNIKNNTKKLPASVSYQPLSTVLYNENGPEGKKLQLKITYTKPKNN